MRSSKSLRKLYLTVAVSFIVVTVICIKGILWAEAPTRVRTQKLPNPSSITIGWVGDMVPSGDAVYNTQVFDQVKQALVVPDLMIGNLEGTFARDDRLSKCRYIHSMCYAFRGDPSFADGLKNSGFDFISLVNNHSYDYGDEGLKDTERELDRVGIPYISPNKHNASVIVTPRSGGPALAVRVGVLGLSSTMPTSTITDYKFITNEVSRLKNENDFVIVVFHGGAEGSDKTVVPYTTEYMGTENRGDVARMARVAVDAGADLVLGSGPHVLRKIETYQDIPIAYSLGNFVGGQERLTTTGILGISGIVTATLTPSALATYAFTSIILSKDGTPSVDTLHRGAQLIESLK